MDQDELFAVALMEQELRELREAEDALRRQRRQQRQLAAALGGHQGSAVEEEILAAVLALTQAQAEEQWQLQDIMDESRREASMGGFAMEQDDEALARIQRQSLLELLRSQLPVTTWSAQEPSQECALCLEEYVPGETVTRLNCLHAFHVACIDPWLEKNSTCPCCKFDLLSDLNVPTAG